MRLNVIAFGLAVAAVGCGASAPAGPEVTGVVTVDGTPADGVRVDFFRLVGNRPMAVASATTGPDGRFRVPADSRLPTGDFKVTTTRPDGGSAALPEVYTDPRKTPLSVTVPAAGPPPAVTLDVRSAAAGQ